MADPLGLVFSGQDNTGAAFKAPWASYDPYQAEMMKGQTQLAMLQEKKKAEEKQKEEDLKLAAMGTPKWTKYLGVAAGLQDAQSNWITKAYAEGRQGEIAQKASVMKVFNKGLVDAINSNYAEYLKAENAVNRDANALREVAIDNFSVFENPELATNDYYPGVADAYKRNLEIARQRVSVLPEGSYDEESIKAYAALLTQNEKRAELLQVPKQYPVTDWMPKAVSEASAIFRKSEQADVSGQIKTTTKEVKEEEAKRILDRYYQGDIRFENQMRYEFNRLPAEQQAVYENPRKYAQDFYYKDLVDKSEVESRTGGGLSLSFGMGSGTPLTPEQVSSGSFDTPVGLDDKGNTTTAVPVVSSVPLNIAGTSGVLDAVSPKYYYDFDYTTGAFATGAPGTSDFATLTRVPTTKSFKFVLQNVETVPVTAKELKFTVGGKQYSIPAGQVLTRETVNLLNQNNISVGRSDVKFTEMVKGTRDASDVLGNKIQKTTYVPLEMIKGEIENQYKKANAVMPQIKTDPRSPVDIFGLIPGTTISGQTVSPRSGATRTTFNPADF